MMQLRSPAKGPSWLADYGRSIIQLFKLIMDAPLRLWHVATAELPDATAYSGGAIFDTTTGLLGYSDGVDWVEIYGAGTSAADARANLGLVAGGAGDIWVEKAGDTMTGQLAVSYALVSDPGIEQINSAALGAGSGGVVRVRPSAKPTAAGQRLGVFQFSAPDSAAVIQNAAAVEAYSTEDWGALAGEGAEIRFGATANASTSRTMVAAITAQGIEPVTDNTFYLGRNDDDSPRAWKGLILKDQTSGTYYRLQINSGAVNLIDLTD